MTLLYPFYGECAIRFRIYYYFMFPRAIPQLDNSSIFLPKITIVNMMETMPQMYVGIF